MENSAAIEQAPVRTKKKKKSFFQKVNENKTYLLFVLPGTLFLIIFFYIPVFANIVAFQNFQYSEKGFLWSLLTSPFVGFKNFEFFFKSADFMLVLRNTVGYSLTFLLLNFFFAIFFGIVIVAA